MSARTLTKAKTYLNDGKVLVMNASKSDALFAVQGSSAQPYIVAADKLAWKCSCEARVECAHIVACKLIYKLPEQPPKLFKSDSEMDKMFVRLGRYESEIYSEEYAL